MNKFINHEVLHVDGKTKVMARGLINEDNIFKGEYKLEGMSWGVNIQLSGCEVGDHDIVPMLGHDNMIEGEVCRQCGIKIS